MCTGKQFIAAAWAAAAVTAAATQSPGGPQGGQFHFTPLPTSAACVPGGTGEQPFIIPPGFVQLVVAREGEGGAPDQWDMNTLNETGRHAGRFLYRTHETTTNGAVSVTDLETGLTRVLVQRLDWNRMDGIVWTPHGTLLAAEEMRPGRMPSLPDPTVPQSVFAGLVFEVDPATGAAAPRPALGLKAHEGMRFDPGGNLYGISETAPEAVPPGGSGGYIFKFVPDRRNDLSSGQLYALKIVLSTGDRTGDAIWVPLDRQAVQEDADAAATAAGATGYGRPEDVEIATSTGNNRGGSNVVYVAITNESRVLRIDLREPGGGADHATVRVSDYVRAGVNAPADFQQPDNLALDKNGNLYITEDGPDAVGDDVWVAIPGRGHAETAESAIRFASLTDCQAEPSGVYFDKSGTKLFINVLHRGGNAPGSALPDLGMVIMESRRLHP
jgi:uncharacterized protein